ncbi:DinB family protein [Deinococcus arenicola]|uniref:DinB family protein n=1 Tax=Deinococcus arenicola TaxID=2994950 RepID=A0ABU4DKY4_9DEIO|nr:DinB family protein [Deinococcus sp. ZS9-10]MDV6373081.1 DinB family protein [Deinococcus sp. ZS9-10]
MTQLPELPNPASPEAEQPQHWLEGILDILREAVEGGTPSEGTAFLDGTAADGTGNNGLLATLDTLSAAQASQSLHGTSIAGHTRHTALHMDVMVRWERDGDRGPFHWKESFLPAEVTDEEWDELRIRLRGAYDALCAFTRTQKDQDITGDATGGLTGGVAHVAYHLGAIRQMVKGLD